MKRLLILFLITILSSLWARTSLAATATSSGQTIKDQVQEKIEDIKNSPKAYAGSITDKNQNTLQIKTGKGEIKLVSIDIATTTFTKTVTKTVNAKYDDVAIGDFIIAMGFKNGNDILNAQKVLITPAITAPKRKIVNAKISSVVKKQVEIETGGTSYTLKFPKSWQGPEINELSEGDNVVVIGEIEGTVLTLRSVFKI